MRAARNQWAGLRRWWQGLAVREQRVLMAGAVVVGLLLGWALVWYPLARTQQNLEARLAARQADLAFMQQAGKRLQGIDQRQQRGKVQRRGKSLLALADASAREAGLGPNMARLEPLDGKRIRMQYQAANFDVLVAWLAGLRRQYGIQVVDLSVDRQSAEGQVDAALTLAEP